MSFPKLRLGKRGSMALGKALAEDEPKGEAPAAPAPTAEPGAPAVLADASVKLTMASRVAVTGPNGAGKVRVTRWRPALVGVS